MEKENEINNFETESYYLTSGEFLANSDRAPANEKVLARDLDGESAKEEVLTRVLLKSQLNRELPANEISSFLSTCQKSSFKFKY